jgi:type IV pilus assembly protein PilY1
MGSYLKDAVMSTKCCVNKGQYIIQALAKCISFGQAVLHFGAIILTLTILFPLLADAAPPALILSQIPLKLATPTQPQVLFALGNSQSMDGTLSGAMMIGSGTQPSALSSLQNSSSPINYTVPVGFVPPLQAAVDRQAPYSVNQSGVLKDNGPSRLNMAKAGIQAIIEAYMQNTDFALATYKTSGTRIFSTWVYYMSPPGGFVFTNTQITGNRYVNNPCYNYLSASTTVASNCSSMTSLFASTTLSNNQYIQISASSDDPSINDVLYGSTQPGIFVSYNGPSPASPFPPNFTIANYNNNSVLIRYSNTRPNISSFATGPTNAGYVPYSSQVMYVKRGYGYGGSQSANLGNIALTMTSAGANPTTSSINTAISKFTPFLQPETNNINSTEIKGIAGQAPVAGLLTTAKSYLTSLSSGSCLPKRYVVLISDGLPTLDLSGKAWPPIGSAAANGYGITATFNADGTLNTTNDQAITDTLTTLASLNEAGIKTYVVGLGAGVDPSINPQAAATLTAMAIAGGTTNYYPASSPEALVENLNNILISVQNGSFSTTEAAVSSTQLQIGTVEYQSSFAASDKLYQDWTGDLTEKALDPKTGSPTGPVRWSAQAALDSQSSRLIATWNPALNNGAGGGAPFQWDNLSTTQQNQLQPTDSLGSSRVGYLRGSSALEKRNGGTFRNRTHLLGDIVDSAPIYVGNPINPGYFTVPSYIAFVQAKADRQGMLYVGANDGMLHAFNASTGAEKFAFIPNSMYPNLYKLSAPLYNQNHLFFVNGSPQSADVVFNDNSWHTILVGGQNGGGNSIYALDISDPMSINTEAQLASKALWEFTDTDISYSFSQPQIGRINAGNSSTLKFAVFFGNGYSSTNNKAILYVVNPETGKLIRKMDLCALVAGVCNNSLSQGLSTVTLGQSDGLQGQPITKVYAGDLQGNLWAIDVSSSIPASWTPRVLFQARDSLGNPQPITTPPLLSLNPSYPRLQGLFVMFGTGQLITATDLTSSRMQTVYGVWDKPFNTLTQNRLSLQSQTLNLVTAAVSNLPQDILTATTNAVPWNNKFGWYADLVVAGQRVITEPVLMNGSFITTLNTPPSTPCGVASSMFLDINYQTGGAYPISQIDINRDLAINASDQYNGASPVGIVLLPGYASAPTTVGVNQNNQVVQLITMSGGQQISVINPNNNIRQMGWWQIQ